MKRLISAVIFGVVTVSSLAWAEPVVIDVEYKVYRSVQFAKLRKSSGNWSSIEINRLKNAILEDGVVDASEKQLIQALLSGATVEARSVLNGKPVSLIVTPNFNDDATAQLSAILGDERGFFGEAVEGHTALRIVKLKEKTSYPYYTDVNAFDETVLPSLRVLSYFFGIVISETDDEFSPVLNQFASVTEGDLITLLTGMDENNSEDWHADCEFSGGPLKPGSTLQLTQAGLNACLANIFSTDGGGRGPLTRARMINQVVASYKNASDKGWLKAE